jgi:hypothetical protein
MQDESWITPELRERAGNYRGKEYRFVRDLSMNTVAKTIVEGHGCLLAYSLDESYGTTKFPLPPRIHSYGHLVYAGKLKLINGEPYVGIKNSWGPHVGENGWQWLSKDFFQGAVKQCGVVIDKPNSLWVSFLDNKGKPRKFPTYFVKSIKYMLDRGSKLNTTYDI